MADRRKFIAGGVGLAVVFARAALAHDAAQGPNGGRVIAGKGHHLELTSKGAELTVYISDEDHADTASKGATGRAVILDGSRQSTVPLAPAEPNKLTGTLEYPLAKGARVVVSARLANGHDLLARFVID